MQYIKHYYSVFSASQLNLGLAEAPLAREHARHMDVFLLEIPEISIESLDESQISRWPLAVITAISRCFRSKSRPWNLKYTNLKYENGRTLRSTQASGGLEPCAVGSTC